MFVRDCVYSYHSILGTTKGKIVRFFHKVGCKCFCKYAGTYGIHHQSGCDGVFAGIEMLLDCPQFRQMVPESVIYYLDPDSLILYDYIEVPLSSILGITTCPQIIVRWASSQFSRMDLQVWCTKLFLFFKLVFIYRRLLHTSLLIHLKLRQLASQL